MAFLHHFPSGATRIGPGGLPGLSGGATRFLHGHRVVAAAGGGAAGSSARGALRFAPGGRGGERGGSGARWEIHGKFTGNDSRWGSVEGDLAEEYEGKVIGKS